MKTGYISGAFDVLSCNLIDTLLWCKQKCDRLILGLYCDDLIYRLTGSPSKIEYKKRFSVLKCFNFIDDVIEVNWENIGRKDSFEQLNYDVTFYACEYGLDFGKDMDFYKSHDVEYLPLPDFSINLFSQSLKYCLENAADKNIVLFGTGNYFDKYMAELGDKFKPVFALDNNKDKWNTKKKGIPIYGIDKLKESTDKNVLVIVCAKNYDSILKQIKEIKDIDYRLLVSNEDFAIFDEYSLLLTQEKEYLDQAHRILMLLLKEFDRVCKKYNLKYTLNDGTLLGAARHHGFIPWDDDADVSMLRSDFEKLQEAAKMEWNDGDFLYVNYNNVGKGVFNDFMHRLVYVKENIPTYIFSKCGEKLRPELKNTICLDIYTLDNASSDVNAHKKQAFYIKTLYGLALGHRVIFNSSAYDGQKTFVKLGINVLHLLGRMIPLKCIFYAYEKICKKYNNIDTESVFETDGPLMMLDEKFSRKYFENISTIKVNDVSLMVPEKYAEYLEEHGYHNFMNYPPANIRKPTHWIRVDEIMYNV